MGGGSFRHITYGGSTMRKLRADLEKLEQTQFDNAIVIDYEEKFPILLFLGIVLAILELLLGERKGAGRIWKGRFEVSEQ